MEQTVLSQTVLASATLPFIVGGAHLLLGSAVFLLTYIAIALEKKIKIDKTISALVGSSLMLFIILHGENKTVDGHTIDAYSRYVRFDVIFLLIGMMLIVNLLSETGFFQYIAIKCAKLGRGRPIPVLSLLIALTAILSAFLDNVTTLLLIAPMTLLVAQQMRIDPVVFLIPITLASNIGGTATLIGDPPNILIGNFVETIGFTDFLIYLAPFILVTLGLFIAAIAIFLRKHLKVNAEERARIMDLNESRAITNRRLLYKSLSVMCLTLIGFLLHGVLHIEPGVVAMGGATLLLLITRENLEKALESVEWPMIFFLVGLFIVVAGAAKVGLIGEIAEALLPIINNNPYIAAVLILWFSGICAGGFNGFGFAAAALPLVDDIAKGLQLSGADTHPLWWALSLGACLGGNLTPIGSIANLVACDISAKSGRPISFIRFTKWGTPTALGSLAISTVYILFLGWMRWS